jgi:DNA-binding NtrC family response regulator
LSGEDNNVPNHQMLMKNPQILIVDDEEKIRKVLTRLLEDEDYRVKSVENGQKAIAILHSYKPDVVLMDQNMPGLNGIEALVTIKEKNPFLTVIIITAHGEVSLAVDAIKKGAYDYLEKPFDNDKLLLLIKRAIDHQRLTVEISNLKRKLGEQKSFESIIGTDEKMKKVIEQAKCVADTDTTVLIQGESGVGKEIIANAIHQTSRRKEGPFVVVNCGAIPLSLIESELFGHEKGSFTDAKETKPGKFEQANGGTLFLDELGELPLDAQVKLLRVLEDKKITRVGGIKPIPVNVRILSATNNNLEERVQKGSFRLDLYYRLNIFPIQIPPLRERRADIPLFIEYFINMFNCELDLHVKNMSGEAVDQLLNYKWPGNIRDLQNAIQSAMILCKEGTITREHLPMRIKGYPLLDGNKPEFDSGLDENLKSINSKLEKELIIEALNKCNYNRTEAANRLKISRKTLFNKMKQYNL